MVSEVYNIDCLEYMKTLPDKFFELAIVDPPYGIGMDGKNNWNGAIFGDNSKASKHPTQKPVPLFEYLILTYTNEGMTVLDNCMGSGTTAIACINSNRNYIGFETNKEYYDYSLKRIELHKQQQKLF